MDKEKRKVSLKKQGRTIADPQVQLKYINDVIVRENDISSFEDKLKDCNQFPLKPSKLEILQVNLGYMCNQTCEHCHVDAGPDRQEIMTREVMKSCLNLIKKANVSVVDLTGGAPEMNSSFRWFVRELREIGVEDIIVRSNLTIALANKKFYDLPEFFKKHQIHVISSLPCYTMNNTDKQRGDGVFSKSIQVIQKLNELGYGNGSGLQLDLVYNPGGAFLPGNQRNLEKDYKRELLNNFNIVFDHLYTITNMPISRFLDYLVNSGQFLEYMNTLVNAFNPATIKGLMCKNTLSVGWDGRLYDCDFNQMLDLNLNEKMSHVENVDLDLLFNRNIITSQHCYGCTAGDGSSCQGATI